MYNWHFIYVYLFYFGQNYILLCNWFVSGIGYFTLPYLVHAHAKHVHACEWNPEAIEALKVNLQLNAVFHKCTIHESDNRKV